MADMQINVYAFLGVLEFSLLLLAVSLFFILRSHKLARRLRVAQEKLEKAQQLPKPASFDQYLRNELIHNQQLMDRAAASQDDAGKNIAEVMDMRKQFLELEVEARALEKNPIAFQDKLATGLGELIERFCPEAEIVMEPVVEAVESSRQAEEAAAAEQRRLLDTHDAEFDRLKKLINNQQDAMNALRRADDETATQDQIHELELKVQKLEALLQFKDSTIEELKKTIQY